MRRYVGRAVQAEDPASTKALRWEDLGKVGVPSQHRVAAAQSKGERRALENRLRWYRTCKLLSMSLFDRWR